MPPTPPTLAVGFTFPENAPLLSHYLHANAATLGLKLVALPAGDAAEQAALVNRLAEQRNVDVLLVEELDSSHDGLTAAVERTTSRKPVVSIGSSTTRAAPVWSLPCGKHDGQVTIAKHMFDRMGGVGKVAFLAESASPAELSGFREALAAFPSIALVATATLEGASTASLRDRGAHLAHQLAASHADLGAILASSDDLALGAIDALGELGRGSAVIVSGFGASPAALVAVSDGTMAATIRQDIDAIAKVALRAGIAVAGGADPGDLTVALELVTAANVARVATDGMRKLADVNAEISQRLDHYRKTAEFLDSVIDNIPLMVFVKEAKNLRMVRINKARAEWFGIDREKQIGTTAHDNYPKELADRFEASDRAVLEDRPDVALSTEHETKSPRGMRWVMTHKFRILDAHGAPSYLVGVSFDTTERKHAELGIAERNAELEKVQATLRAQQEQLIAAEKAATASRIAADFASAELTRKVSSILAVVDAAAAGDLTRKIEVRGADEIGRLGDGLTQCFATMRRSISEIALNATSLGAASEELTAVSKQLAANAAETSSQATAVSFSTAQVNRHVQTVATGTDEMSASILEIARNASEAARIASSAVGVADRTNAVVGKLGESSADIGKVIKVITSIAEQTNLLALNATIEAARAGQAGKGFSVVANEVKALARETAKATQDISQKIEAIQSDTRSAVAAIGQISDTIRQISGFQQTIASAVEEQTMTTETIAGNVSEAARGSEEIAETISSVALAAQSASAGALDTDRAAAELSRMAAGMQALVNKFKT